MCLRYVIRTTETENVGRWQHIYSFLGGIYTQYRWVEEEIPLLPDRDNKRININIYIINIYIYIHPIKMDKRRDPTIARPKERRKRGDMSHDHVRCYNVRLWSHHVLRSCEWRQQPWEPELSIATRSATAGIRFSRKYYSLTTVHLSCLWKKASLKNHLCFHRYV